MASSVRSLDGDRSPVETVLVVDDDEVLLRATARLVEGAGYHVVTASGPFGVTSLVLRHAPAAVVLDVTMPGLDGAQLAQLLGDVPIVFYSGIDTEELRALSERTSGSRGVSKLDGPEALVEALRGVISAPKRSKSTLTLRAQRPRPGLYSFHLTKPTKR